MENDILRILKFWTDKDVTPETKIDALDLDSIDWFSAINDIEDQLGLIIEDHHAERWITIQDAIEYLEAQNAMQRQKKRKR